MTERDLVAALQAAILRADSNWVSQPSHLRRRLEEEFGADARQHRAQIHQLIVAAEERIPIRLKRNSWSPTERAELGQMLVVTRGWTAEASDWAVTTWAAALGLTDERPAAVPAVQLTRSEPMPAPQPKRAQGPESGALPAATEVPPHHFAEAAELPSEFFAGATELPVNGAVAAAGLPDTARRAPATSNLPKGGTRGVAKKAVAFLGHPLDAAYLVKAGASPALLLLAVPIGVAGFVNPALGGMLLPLFALIMIFGSAFWPARILALQGDDVWLLAKKQGLSMKPRAVLAQGKRSEIAFAGGRPFPSVRFAGQRLWFQFPVTGAARKLPTTKAGQP